MSEVEDKDYFFVVRFKNGGYIRALHHQFVYGLIAGLFIGWMWL